MTTSERYHRDAIFLNNAGVSLLKRGCYRQALETLQDAVVVMKIACGVDSIPNLTTGSCVRSPSGCSSPKNILDVLSVMVERATRHSSSPETSPDYCPSSLLEVTVIADDAISVEEVFGVSPFKGSVIFPIRIESYDSAQRQSETEAAITSTIILNNFGLSCLCRSTTVDKNAGESLRKNAFKIFELCQAILFSRSSKCTDQQKLKKLFFLGFVVLSMSVNLLRLCARHEEALAYHPKLERLKEGVRELEVISPPTNNAAAA